jgi:lysozyme
MNDKPVKIGNKKNLVFLGVISAAVAAGYQQWESSGKTITKPYFDIGHVATVCDGHTGNVDMNRIYTKQECDSFRNEDILKHQEGILKCITVPLNQNQIDAFTLFASNVGVSAFCSSNAVLKPLNQGNYSQACYGMTRYVYVGKVYVKGLANRREFEKSLCLKPL